MAVPKPPPVDSGGDLLSPPDEKALANATAPQQKKPAAPPPPKLDEDWTLEFPSTTTRLNGGYGIEILEESDPYVEIAEHAAITYANGQTAAARAMLEGAVRDNSDPNAIRLWHMLFDLLRVTGEQTAFDALGMEFARVCELSPPSWSVGSARESRAAAPTAAKGTVSLQGVLSGNPDVFADLRQALVKKEPRRLDMGRLAGLDAEASTHLAEILGQARRHDLAWGISHARAQAERLLKRASPKKQDIGIWQLLFEMYQFLGEEDIFEDKAVEYAVTFELSPPSWEPPRTPPAIADTESDAAEEETAGGEIPQLEGDLLQGNLEAVEHLLTPGKEVSLDFSRIRRVDFISAGMLVNILQNEGGKVTVRHPNWLVAELFRVMGIDQVAHVEMSRH
ncbi:MAG: STAS domain-containing protein [Zoogloeaceae bacterium]|nr:STAS domain-containing protein [Zoogloeaceae bacterium]